MVRRLTITCVLYYLRSDFHWILNVLSPKTAYLIFLDLNRKVKINYNNVKNDLDEALNIYGGMKGYFKKGCKKADSKGIVRFKGHVWLGNNTHLQRQIMRALHNSAIGGHSGFRATYMRIKHLFAWPGMKQHIKEHVQCCQVCQ